MNIDAIIFLKWAVGGGGLFGLFLFLHVVWLTSIDGRKCSNCKSLAEQKSQIPLTQLFYRENLMEAIMYNAYTQHLGDKLWE